jgi:Peptidase A4 family
MRRTSRLRISILAACVPALGLLMAYGPAASAGIAAGRPAVTHAAAAAAARAALRQLAIGQHSADQRVSGHTRHINGLTKVHSNNWSGYADTGSSYSTVTGRWTEPSVSCTSTTSLAAFWVGIDGFNSSSVEQDGTLAECYGGTAYYYTWWEMYPSNAIQVVGGTLRPGDHISASVVRSGTSYTLKVTDSTRSGDSFTTKQGCSSCANTSAEWIAEAPSGSSGIYPLPNFHSWSETGATVKSGSKSGVISTFSDDEITMVDSAGHVEAQPGALNGSGNGFTVTWKRST